MNPLLMSRLLITPTLQTPSMTGDRVLMGLNTPLVTLINSSAQLVVQSRARTLPSKRQVRGRDDLDEVHEVISHLIGMLIRPIERVDVVVRPSSRSRSLVVLVHIRNHHIAQLGSKSQMMNNVRKRMAIILDVVV